MRNPKHTVLPAGPEAPALARRTALAGAGAVGALATAAAVLPGSGAQAPEQAAAGETAAHGSAGYRVTEHVRRYYASARI